MDSTKQQSQQQPKTRATAVPSAMPEKQAEEPIKVPAVTKKEDNATGVHKSISSNIGESVGLEEGRKEGGEKSSKSESGQTGSTGLTKRKKCSACGEMGHNKRSKECRSYNLTTPQQQPASGAAVMEQDASRECKEKEQQASVDQLLERVAKLTELFHATPAKNPSTTPTPAEKPSVTPIPVEKPKLSAVPRKQSATPTAAKKPSATPIPAQKPKLSAVPKKPSATPTAAKKPSATPTAAKKPSATPITAEKPSATGGEKSCRSESGQTGSTGPTKRQCSACGEVGHTKRSKECRLYMTTSQEQATEPASGGAVLEQDASRECKEKEQQASVDQLLEKVAREAKERKPSDLTHENSGTNSNSATPISAKKLCIMPTPYPSEKPSATPTPAKIPSAMPIPSDKYSATTTPAEKPGATGGEKSRSRSKSDQTSSTGSTKRKCSACGESGHTKRSKECRLYTTAPQEQATEPASGGAVMEQDASRECKEKEQQASVDQLLERVAREAKERKLLDLSMGNSATPTSAKKLCATSSATPTLAETLTAPTLAKEPSAIPTPSQKLSAMLPNSTVGEHSHQKQGFLSNTIECPGGCLVAWAKKPDKPMAFLPSIIGSKGLEESKGGHTGSRAVKGPPKCGACGEVGHTMRSKKCRWYTLGLEEQ